MNQFTEIASGKCEHCGDQLLSIPGRTPEQPRRVVCPICIANQLEDLQRQIPNPDWVDS